MSHEPSGGAGLRGRQQAQLVDRLQPAQARARAAAADGEARPVELGDVDPKFVEIRAGLSAGERYVAENSFVVKAEMGKGDAGHD